MYYSPTKLKWLYHRLKAKNRYPTKEANQRKWKVCTQLHPLLSCLNHKIRLQQTCKQTSNKHILCSMIETHAHSKDIIATTFKPTECFYVHINFNPMFTFTNFPLMSPKVAPFCSIIFFACRVYFNQYTSSWNETEHKWKPSPLNEGLIGILDVNPSLKLAAAAETLLYKICFYPLIHPPHQQFV